MAAPPDPRILALQAMSDRGVERVLEDSGLKGPFCLERVLRHRKGRRCALLVSGDAGKVVVKAYRDDEPPRHFMRAMAALEARARGEDGAARPARVLAYDPALRFIATEWFDAPSGLQLLESGDGARCGSLAARWLLSVRVPAGRFRPAKEVVSPLERAADKVKTINKVSRPLGQKAAELHEVLRGRAAPASADVLCHGSFKPEHLFDLGLGPGLVDWDSAKAGPPELDAGSFLGKLSMLRIERPPLEGEVGIARYQFLSEACGVLDRTALAWYEAFSLLKGAGTACRLYGEAAEGLALQILDQSFHVLAGSR